MYGLLHNGGDEKTVVGFNIRMRFITSVTPFCVMFVASPVPRLVQERVQNSCQKVRPPRPTMQPELSSRVFSATLFPGRPRPPGRGR